MLALRLRFGFGRPPDDGTDPSDFAQRMERMESRLGELQAAADALDDGHGGVEIPVPPRHGRRDQLGGAHPS